MKEDRSLQYFHTVLLQSSYSHVTFVQLLSAYCYLVQVPDIVDILLDGTVRTELA